MSSIVYNNSYTNKSLFPSGASCNVRSGASTSSPILYTVQKGKSVGKATGQLFYSDADGDKYWFQIISTQGSGYAWVRTDAVTFVNVDDLPVYVPIVEYNGSSGNEVLKATLANDQTLCKQLLILSEQLTRRANAGKDNSQFQPIFDILLSSYKQSQQKAFNFLTSKVAIGTLLTSDSTFGSLYSWLWSKFGKGLSGNLGVVWYVPVAITASVGLAIGVIAYEMFKPDYERGKVNLKVSGNLQKAIQTLSAQEQVDVLKDLQSQIDDAYNAGRSDSGGIMTALKYIGYAALFGGTIWGASKLSDMYKNYKAKK